MEDRLLSHAQVAKRLGVRPSLILRLIRRRDLAAVKVGRHWRIEPQALAAYIDSRRQDARVLEPAPVDDRQIPLFDGGGEVPPLTIHADPTPVEVAS